MLYESALISAGPYELIKFTYELSGHQFLFMISEQCSRDLLSSSLRNEEWLS